MQQLEIMEFLSKKQESRERSFYKNSFQLKVLVLETLKER